MPAALLGRAKTILILWAPWTRGLIEKPDVGGSQGAEGGREVVDSERDVVQGERSTAEEAGNGPAVGGRFEQAGPPQAHNATVDSCGGVRRRSACTDHPPPQRRAPRTRAPLTLPHGNPGTR